MVFGIIEYAVFTRSCIVYLKICINLQRLHGNRGDTIRTRSKPAGAPARLQGGDGAPRTDPIDVTGDGECADQVAATPARAG